MFFYSTKLTSHLGTVVLYSVHTNIYPHHEPAVPLLIVYLYVIDIAGNQNKLITHYSFCSVRIVEENIRGPMFEKEYWHSKVGNAISCTLKTFLLFSVVGHNWDILHALEIVCSIVGEVRP